MKMHTNTYTAFDLKQWHGQVLIQGMAKQVQALNYVYSRISFASWCKTNGYVLKFMN